MNHIDQWIEKIINGPTGFKVEENVELVIYADREKGIAAFVINCLANPECQGSQEVLRAITKRRTLLLNKLNKESK